MMSKMAISFPFDSRSGPKSFLTACLRSRPIFGETLEDERVLLCDIGQVSPGNRGWVVERENEYGSSKSYALDHVQAA